MFKTLFLVFSTLVVDIGLFTLTLFPYFQYNIFIFYIEFTLIYFILDIVMFNLHETNLL